MFTYAVLNGSNICVEVKSVSEEMDAPNLVSVDELDTSLMGKKYEEGIWSDVEPIPVEPMASTDEKILAELQYQTALLEMSAWGGGA